MDETNPHLFHYDDGKEDPKGIPPPDTTQPQDDKPQYRSGDTSTIVTYIYSQTGEVIDVIRGSAKTNGNQ